MAVNYSEKYASIVDATFSETSRTEIAYNTDYDFDGAKTLHIYTLGTVEVNNYTRDNTNRFGEIKELQDTQASYTMTQDKGWTFTVDRGNQVDQVLLDKAGQGTIEQIKQKIIPMVDTYRLGVMGAGATAAGQVITTAPTKDNVLDLLSQMSEYLDEAGVPLEGRHLWITNDVARFLRTSSEFSSSKDLSKALNVTGEIGEIWDVPVLTVSQSRMPANAKAIMVYNKSIIAPRKLNFIREHINPPTIDGILVEGRIYYDCFVLKNKAKGLSMIQIV